MAVPQKMIQIIYKYLVLLRMGKCKELYKVNVTVKEKNREPLLQDQKRQVCFRASHVCMHVCMYV
jgi:hypothetical protein